MDESKVESGAPASFQYSVMDNELSSNVGKGKFGEPFGETKKRSITTKHLIIACIIFTTVIFIGFAIGCIALLAEKQSPKNEVLNQEEIYRRQDQLWQNASEILNKKIDLLQNKTDDILKLPRQDDLHKIVSDTLMKKFDLLRREINEIVADSSQDEDQISRYIASNDRVYKFYKDRKNYTDAKATCESTGTQLVTDGVRDLDIKRELLNFVDTLPLSSLCWGHRCLWIGLTYSEANAVWTWSDGISNSSTIDWAYDQPDPRDKKEDCSVTYLSDHKIHDYPCDTNFYFICEA